MKLSFIFLTAIILFYAELFSKEHCENDTEVFHYYSTVADEKHFLLVRNLIASIHQVDFDFLDEIVVFDIGLSHEQRKELGRMQKVSVYDIELTHPDLLTYFVTNPWNKQVRGWFAWKPVVLKQSLEMFPYLLYLDAGTLVLTSPCDLFKHIKQNGYFLLNVNHNIVDRLTNPLRDKLIPTLAPEQLHLVLHPDTWMVAGGIQGLSQAVYDDYIYPIYLLSYDLTLFADDGSAKLGFGEARHDQTIFSIFARVLNFRTNAGEGWSDLSVDGKMIPFHYHWNSDNVNNRTCLFTCRFNNNLTTGKLDFIRWKSSQNE
ncbi:MAG: hypothetical protein LLG04_06200 [Parachlamydia sp.]|nr:hypothetical protein [Parachlamydia sp.]